MTDAVWGLSIYTDVSQSYMLNTRGGRIKYGILFIFGLFYEYSDLEYERIHVISRGKPGGMRYSYSCGCATGIREYLFST